MKEKIFFLSKIIVLCIFFIFTQSYKVLAVQNILLLVLVISIFWGINISRIVFLLLFIYFQVTGLSTAWHNIFATGIVVTLLMGRFFCGWICHMNTVFKGIELIYTKVGFKRYKVPGVLRKKYIRYIALFIYIASMITTTILRIHNNVILYVTILSIIITLVFEEELWHKYLCPLGTVFSIFSSKSIFGMQVSDSSCISCGLCEKVCPNKVIIVKGNKKRDIQNKDCLTCFECKYKCPKNAISYSKLNKAI